MVELTITDNLGGTNTTQTTFSGVMPPTASVFKSVVEGNSVLIEWSGNSEEWAVMRNGELIQITTSGEIKDKPILEGNHTYNIYPVIDGQIIEIGTGESTTIINLVIEDVEEPPGPDTTSGVILSLILILFTILVVGLSYFRRRNLY